MNRALRLAPALVLLSILLGRALAQEVAYFLALEGPSAAEVELSRKSGAGPAAAVGPGRTAAQLRIAEIESAQRDLEPAIAAAGARIITRHSRLANGLGILAPTSALPVLRALPGVTSVAPLRHYRPLLESSVPFVGAPAVWGTHTGNATGRGIRVGVIDSGIDYNHADFGGSGSVNDYFNNDSRLIEIGSFPTKKVAGGYDFVGDNYDSTGQHGSPTPVPDFDPLDPAPNGHGSHVASTVAGYGVLTNGVTYAGAYDATLQTSRFQVAPGVAPEATLYAIKVFGNDGSTSGGIVVSALEWALDPDGNGDFSDHLDVVNLSLGGTFEPVSASDIEGKSIDLLTQSGVVIVVAAGNNGNVHYITGMPAGVDRAITVANSIDDGASFSTIKVTAPPVLAGDYTSTEGEFTKPLAEVGPITAPVVYVSPAGACSTIVNAAAVKGKIALIDRGSCFFVDKVRRAQQAGAIGVIMVNNTDGPPIVMGGQGDTSDITIPGVMIRFDDGDRLKSQLNNGLTVTLAAFAAVAHPELADQLENSSTRGPRLPDSHLKPDIAAPGTGIVAASVATGMDSRPLTGTSMASPHVAGAAALLKQLHPDWTPLDIKTALMNTAVPTRNERKEPYPESRTGAGRLQVNRAASLTALARADTSTGEVSISFGALQLLQPYSETRTLRVFNLSNSQQVFTLAVSNTITEPGVTLTPLVASVTVPARGSATVPVRFDANPALFDQTGDPTTPAIANDRPRPQIFEASGQVWFHSASQSLHVPWYSAVRALSDEHVTATNIGIPSAATAVVPLPTRGDSAHRKPIVSVFEFGAVSPSLILPAESASGDLLAIGAASDFATQGSIDTTTVYFGLVVAGYWHTPQRVFQKLRVSIDATGDLSADYDVLNATAAGLLTEAIDDPQNMNDALVAVAKDRSRTTGAITAGSIFNVLPPSVRDTAPFHNSVAILAVPAKAIGLTANKTTFRYSANVQGLGASDSVGWVEFDAAHPLVDATPFGIDHTPFADEGPSPKASVNRALAQTKGFGKNNPLKALVLHQHNAAGKQVDVVTLDITTPDADGDARVDIEELTAFGDLTSNGANDRDGDGFSDAAESLAGTNPLDPASFLHITSVGQVGATIRWASVAGHSYTIERASSLSGPFTPIHTGAAATAPENAFTDPEAGSGTHYYRVRVQ